MVLKVLICFFSFTWLPSCPDPSTPATFLSDTPNICSYGHSYWHQSILSCSRWQENFESEIFCAWTVFRSCCSIGEVLTCLSLTSPGQIAIFLRGSRNSATCVTCCFVTWLPVIVVMVELHNEMQTWCELVKLKTYFLSDDSMCLKSPCEMPLLHVQAGSSAVVNFAVVKLAWCSMHCKNWLPSI